MDPDGPEPAEPVPASRAEAEAEPDLERIAGDLADVERALERLEDTTYWTDEVTGEAIPDHELADDPTARRRSFPAAPAPASTPPPTPPTVADPSPSAPADGQPGADR